MLYPNFINLLEISKKARIRNKLITNGILLSKNYQILDYLDSLALSLDSIDESINKEIERGKSHYETIQEVLNFVQNKDLELSVNTIVSRKNMPELNKIGNFLDNYKIDKWKFYKFIPLRERAIKNKKEFEITNKEFNELKINFGKFKNIKKTEYKTLNDLEENYMILPNGDIIKTIHGIDIKQGNALYDNVVELIDKNINNMKKIKILVSYDDNKIRARILNTIEKLNYVEVVGVISSHEETYNKILDLKPEMVFAKYNFEEEKNLFDIIKKTKMSLENELPIFNIISSDIEISEVKEIMQEVGDNLNAVIQEEEPLEFRLKTLLNEYRNYKKMI